MVGRDDDDESIAAGSEISDVASWETVNDNEMEVLEDSREVCFFFHLYCDSYRVSTCFFLRGSLKKKKKNVIWNPYLKFASTHSISLLPHGSFYW